VPGDARRIIGNAGVIVRNIDEALMGRERLAVCAPCCALAAHAERDCVKRVAPETNRNETLACYPETRCGVVQRAFVKPMPRADTSKH
jgi:hypothetical protein